jgi:5-methylcytosine-specific restriction endonuclease McrA
MTSQTRCAVPRKVTDEEKAAFSAAMKARWADPVWRANIMAKRAAPGWWATTSAAMSAGSLASETKKRASSERMKQRWEDPAFRAMMSDRLKNPDDEERSARAGRLRAQWEDPEFREAAVAADKEGSVKGTCVYCGGPATCRDHDVPRFRGGTDDPSNLVLACKSCNSRKGTLTGDEYREALRRPVVEAVRVRRPHKANQPYGNRRALAKPKGTCVYCSGVATETDHDVPRSRGGSDDASNLVPSCMHCNAQKGRMTGDEFRAARKLRAA